MNPTSLPEPEARNGRRDRYDAATLVARFVEDVNFQQLRREVLAQLRRDDRQGAPWLEFGPEQLPQLASDRRRAANVVSRVNRMAGALPGSLQPLMWTLILNPRAPVEVPSGPALPRPAFASYMELVSEGLYGIGERGKGLTDTPKHKRAWDRARLDPGVPALMLADKWVGSAPTYGMPVSINAAAMLAGQVIASPSQGHWPVHYTVASVKDGGQVVLQPLAVPPKPPSMPPSFRFDKGI